MDAIVFLVLGGVFTSAMSGNTILLGLAAGQGHVEAALRSLAALLGYVTGISAGSLSLAKFQRGHGWTLALEALFLAAFVALWFVTGPPSGSLVIYGLVVLSAIAMGLQGAIGHAIGVPGIMTVVFTSTYTAIISDLVERALAGHRPLLTTLAAQQLITLVTYLGSAVVVGIVATHGFKFAPIFPLAVVLVLLAGLRLRLIHLERR